MIAHRLPAFVVIPLVTAFVLPLFGKKGKSIATFLANLATICLLVLAVSCIGQSGIYEVGRWSIPLGINLVLDGLSCLLLLAVGVVSTAAMLFSARYMEQYTAKAKYLSLFMLMVAGMNGVVLSGDIFNLFVFLEIASIASYALVGFGCEHEELEASFKYMVLGSIASMFILFAIALVYGNTASLNMAFISQAISRPLNPGLAFALALFIVGFGLKAALMPFHAWLPNAHPGAGSDFSDAVRCTNKDPWGLCYLPYHFQCFRHFDSCRLAFSCDGYFEYGCRRISGLRSMGLQATAGIFEHQPGRLRNCWCWSGRINYRPPGQQPMGGLSRAGRAFPLGQSRGLQIAVVFNKRLGTDVNGYAADA